MLRNGSLGTGLDLAYVLHRVNAKINKGGEEQYGNDASYYAVPGELCRNQSHQQIELERSAPQKGDDNRYSQRKGRQRPVKLPLPPQVSPPGRKLVGHVVDRHRMSSVVMTGLLFEHVLDGRRSLTPGGRVGG